MNDVATMKEQGIDTVPFQMWRGVAVPKGIPADAMNYWEGVMRKVTASKAFKDRLRGVSRKMQEKRRSRLRAGDTTPIFK